MTARATPGTAADESHPRVPVLVLGGSGYVAGEALRWLGTHPVFRPAVVVSESQPGESIDKSFPHLAGLVEAGFLPRRFAAGERLEDELARLNGQASAAGADGGEPRLGILCAAPHGHAAMAMDRALAAAAAVGLEARAVDLSADFRYSTAAAYEAVYRQAHGAPQRLAEFDCQLPELATPAAEPTGGGWALRHGARHIGHPGCFTTAVTLAAAPLVAMGLVAPGSDLVAVGITGSTGAGRTPAARTHHPERRSNLVAYEPFTHRHAPEMEGLLERLAERQGGHAGSARASSPPHRVRFLPHSGPFARGIHVTLTARAAAGLTQEEARRCVEAFYESTPFVRASPEPPGLQSVVGSNRCRLSVSVRDEAVVVFSVLDNLVKGAAGGAIQWLNRLFDLDETTGLLAAGPGWL